MRKRDFFEASAGYCIILAAIWSPEPLQDYLFWSGLAFIAAVTFARHPTLHSLGLSFAAKWRSWWVVALALASATVAVWIAWRLNTLHLPFAEDHSWWLAALYVAWALVQQFILQDFFFTRLVRLLPSRSAAVAVAGLLFAVAHLPNPLLTVATLVWGVAACALFLRYRDLYSLGVAHAVFGLCLAVTIPNTVHHSMRVGLHYYQYQRVSKLDQGVRKGAALVTQTKVSAHIKPR